MKNILMIIGVLFFFGCAVIPEQNDVDTDLKKSREMGEEMLDAFRKRDLQTFVKYIPASGRSQYGKKEFDREQQEVASRLGEIVGYRFLTKLEMEPLTNLVWAVRFRSNNLKGDPIYKEALFTVVIGEVDDSRKVFLFGFK